MVSFYPGPSRIHDGVSRWTADAVRNGILSMNHRSPEFMKLAAQTCARLHAKLNIPKTYSIFFVSSATECWEILAQSLVERNSLHLHNGAFGEKWYQYTKRLRPHAVEFPFDREALPDLAKASTSSDALVCVTHNETSNGTALPTTFLRDLGRKFSSNLIAVDATSSMAGVSLDFNLGDVWFASVQKCFGLPAGLALLICSPRALERARRLADRFHYNSLVFLAEMMTRWQTTHTPPVLHIYLLYRSLARRQPIREVEKNTSQRSASWYTFLEDRRELKPLIANPLVRSKTVIAVTAAPDCLKKTKRSSRRAGYLLGNGYGQLAESTFRLANFPALTNAEIKGLKGFLKDF